MRPPIGAAAQWPSLALLARMRRVNAEHEICELVLVKYMWHERGELAVLSLPHQGDHSLESAPRRSALRSLKGTEARGQYVGMQGHGQGKRARICAPSNEALVGSKTPAGGGRAERAEEPTLLIGPSIRAREA